MLGASNQGAVSISAILCVVQFQDSALKGINVFFSVIFTLIYFYKGCVLKSDGFIF